MFAETRHSYGDKEKCFTFFEGRITKGELQRKVHKDIRWVRAEEFGSICVLPGRC